MEFVTEAYCTRYANMLFIPRTYQLLADLQKLICDTDNFTVARELWVTLREEGVSDYLSGLPPRHVVVRPEV